MVNAWEIILFRCFVFYLYLTKFAVYVTVFLIRYKIGKITNYTYSQVIFNTMRQCCIIFIRGKDKFLLIYIRLIMSGQVSSTVSQFLPRFKQKVVLLSGTYSARQSLTHCANTLFRKIFMTTFLYRFLILVCRSL